MILGNFSAFLLAPFLATSSFMGFGFSDGNAFANAKHLSNDSRNSSEWRSSDSDDRWDRWNWGNHFGQNPRISEIAPDDGAIGTEVTLEGRRFDADSVVRFGEGVINDVDVSDNGRTLSFIVPEYMGKYCPPREACIAIAYEVEAGDYSVRVVDEEERTSNSVNFTVTEDDEEPGDGELAIDSIDGPTALNLEQEGTWTVNVSGADSDLRYSVRWGDEGMFRSMLSLLNEDEDQASATFTHVYNEPGVYTPEFTVTNEDGDTVSKSAAAVTVGEDGDIIRVDTIAPTSTKSGETVTLNGVGFDNDTSVWVGSTQVESVKVESDSKLSFTVPSIAIGDYQVIVVSDEGQSQAVDLKIEKEIKARVSVNGVNAPTRLDVGEEGTWTVNAMTNTDSNLSYSVDWGESNVGMRRASVGVETQSSATFTHSYVEAGTYHPKFTVTDEDGNKSSVSASVVVK